MFMVAMTSSSSATKMWNRYERPSPDERFEFVGTTNFNRQSPGRVTGRRHSKQWHGDVCGH